MPAVGSRQTRKLCRSRALRQPMARVWPSRQCTQYRLEVGVIPEQISPEILGGWRAMVGRRPSRPGSRWGRVGLVKLLFLSQQDGEDAPRLLRIAGSGEPYSSARS